MQSTIHKVFAGAYWSDAGALMGVLPWSIWSSKISTDDRHRLLMSLNLLLIRTPERNILVDTGLGNRLNKKQNKIYDPTDFMLPASLAELGIKDTDVTDVIMTHLHFDHAGGIITGFGDMDRLTFPNATYWIQRSEWLIAKDPDALNRAAYSFDQQLSMLGSRGKIELVEGEHQVCPEVKVRWTGGHSKGSQIVEIDIPSGFYIYAGDIIPTVFHIPLPVCSAYDVSREQTFAAKEYIYETLKAKDGFLLLDHDNDAWQLHVKDIL